MDVDILEIPIIIATINRHHYLERIQAYYHQKHYEQNVIIADGTDKKWPEALKSQMTYLHLPGLSFRERILSGLQETQSDLVVLCADDDFVVPVGIETCVKFLRQNPDYSCAQGLYGRFVIKNNRISYSQQRPWLQSIIDDNPLDRIKKAFIPKYVPHIYAVHRRENLENVLLLTGFSDDEYLLVFEELLTYIACLTGKCKKIQVVYNFREMENEKTYKIEKYTMIARSLLSFKEAALSFIPDDNQRNAFTQVVDQITNNQMNVYFSIAYEKEKPPSRNHLVSWESLCQSLPGFRSVGRIKIFFRKSKDSSEKNLFPLTQYSDQAYEDLLIIDNVIKNWKQQQYAKKSS